MKRTLTLFLLIFIFSPTFLFSQQGTSVCFSAPTAMFTDYGQDNCVISEDFTGDGNLDLVVGSINFLRLLKGAGDGTFGTPSQIAGVGLFNALVSGDFNNDGKKDIAATTLSKELQIFLGDGAGNFGTPTKYTLSNSPKAITKGDVNNDGKMDLIVATYDVGPGIPQRVVIFPGNGSGGFGTVGNFDVYAQPKTVSVTDINKDGKIDIVVGCSTHVTVLTGDGSGNFVRTDITVSGSQTFAITGDFNKDGNNDIAALDAYANSNKKITVLYGNGAGSFTQVLFNAADSSYSLASGDFNNDGIIDFASTASGTYGEVVFLGYGDSTYAKGANWLKFGRGYQNTISTVADFNKDGRLDIATERCILLNNAAPLLKITSVTDATCFGYANGKVTFSASSGAPPYKFGTLSFHDTGSFNILPAGSSYLLITDSMGCVDTASFTINQPTALALKTFKDSARCFKAKNGAIKVVASGGTTPYTYLWSSGDVTDSVPSLSAGIYSITVTDKNGCTKVKTDTILQPDSIKLTFSQSVIKTCSGPCDNWAAVKVNGGTKPYAYLWDSATLNQTGDTIKKMCIGAYSVTVTDARMCSTTQKYTLVPSPQVNSEVFVTNIAAVDQASVSPSFSTYYNYNLPVSIVPNPLNPKNYVDPGRPVRFKVSAHNKKNDGKSIVSGLCKVFSNSPFMTLTDSGSALNNIGWNSVAWSADEFEILINPLTPPGTNIYVDYSVEENSNSYKTTCAAIPVTPLNYTKTTTQTIDDDNNPDSKGNDNDKCEVGETIEFYPWLNNVSSLNAEYVRGSFENLDNLSVVNIWNNHPGVNGTVYSSSWWNYNFAKPNTISTGGTNMTPEFDFVFDYNSPGVSNLQLYMVMAGGFKLFNDTALSLIQWTLPFNFSAATVTGIDEQKKEDLFEIIPNPSYGKVTLVIAPQQQIKSITVVNQLGQKIYETTNAEALNTKELATGIYWIQVVTGKGWQARKVVIY